MIPIKELRIGNWVHYYCHPQTEGCNCDKIDFQHQVEMLDDEGNVSVGHQSIFSITNDELDEIEITCDILLEFGFKKREGRDRVYSNKIGVYFIDFTKTDSNSHIYLFNYYGKGTCHLDCKYVHQLQNIIFFIAGAEIQRNTKK